MGRGKTRVILPMLFLYFARSRCRQVIRAHFLSPLLSEAQQFMHRYLSATSARLGIFEQPFHRQVGLNVRKLEFLCDSLDGLKTFGGIQMVAPEYSMSHELKRLEVGSKSPLAQAMDEILDNNQFVDVLDECDALLHHKYHLRIERWIAAQALLRFVADEIACRRVHKVLEASHVSCSTPDYATRLGAYQGTRLSAVVLSTEHLRKELKEALVLDLIAGGPLELIWLTTIGGGSAREALVRALTN
ncbi:hypothetical protein PsorP6_003619 [Peronosclerospora sorghi]|uniref:Uncharacterized protein n=1 Tax=Peronosclerospora sorghi TaxID=230839 RepID=A0ACC0VRW1_9STRA|nr:hypothetical protein PsorP6_003619 [Peronosclerospora sorghi]